jgi:hypothetical protein
MYGRHFLESSPRTPREHERTEVAVADVRPPQEWVGPAFDSNSGTLADANDLGVTLELADGTMTFIPWTAIRRVTLLR